MSSSSMSKSSMSSSSSSDSWLENDYSVVGESITSSSISKISGASVGGSVTFSSVSKISAVSVVGGGVASYRISSISTVFDPLRSAVVGRNALPEIASASAKIMDRIINFFIAIMCFITIQHFQTDSSIHRQTDIYYIPFING